MTVVGPPATFATLRADWDRLAAASGRIFATWEWASIWWSLYGRGRRLALVPVHGPDGHVEAILPLFAHVRRPLRIARFVGHEGGDEMGPICATRSLPAVAAILRSGAAATTVQADLLLAEGLPGVDWRGMLPGTTLRRVSSPAIALTDTDWDGFLGSLSRKLRREIVHGERRLHRDHAVTYRLTTEPDRLDADLDTLFDLHRARFPSGSSLLGRSSFYRRFARAALERGWLRLSILELDGRPAAARLDFRFADVHFAYNAGRDPRWNRDSPGVILRAMTLRDAIADGVSEYRFLRGDESYKYRWATHDRESLTVAVPRTPLGRLATFAAGSLGAHRLGRTVLSRTLDG